MNTPTSEPWMVKFSNMIYAGETFVALITDTEERDRVVSMHNAALTTKREQVRLLREQVSSLSGEWEWAERNLKNQQVQNEGYRSDNLRLRRQLAVVVEALQKIRQGVLLPQNIADAAFAKLGKNKL